MNLHGICFLSLFFVVSKRVSLEAKLHLRLKASSRSIVLGSRTRSWPEACQLLLKKKRLSSRGASLDKPAPKCSCLGSPVQGSCGGPVHEDHRARSGICASILSRSVDWQRCFRRHSTAGVSSQSDLSAFSGSSSQRSRNWPRRERDWPASADWRT